MLSVPGLQTVTFRIGTTGQSFTLLLVHRIHYLQLNVTIRHSVIFPSIAERSRERRGVCSNDDKTSGSVKRYHFIRRDFSSLIYIRKLLSRLGSFFVVEVAEMIGRHVAENHVERLLFPVRVDSCLISISSMDRFHLPVTWTLRSDVKFHKHLTNTWTSSQRKKRYTSRDATSTKASSNSNNDRNNR